jgi:acyl dehydratase
VTVPAPSNPTGSDYAELVVGTYEDALAMVGHRTEPEIAQVPVELGQVKAFAALLEDPNPCYWDSEVSQRIWGTQIAPATLVMASFSPLRWHPAERPKAILSTRVPLPGTTIINVASTQRYHRPIRVGDRFTVVQEVTNVSPLKRTRLGAGHFVTTVATYRDADGEIVATNENTLYRYTPEHTDA